MALPLICPPQNLAPHEEESRLFNRPWYLFFNRLARDLNKSETLAASASSSLTLSTSMADLAGATITLNKTGRWLVIANVTFTADSVSSGVVAELNVAGSPFGASMQSDVIGTYNLAYSWFYDNTGSNTAKIRAMKNAGAGVSTAYSGSSNIMAVFLG